MDSKRYQCINPPPFPYTLARMVFKKIGVYANHVKKIYHKCFINDIFFSISEIKDKSFTKRDFFLSFCGVCVWLVWLGRGGGFPYLIFFIFTTRCHIFFKFEVNQNSQYNNLFINLLGVKSSIYIYKDIGKC